jgi:hypothetical protein
MDESQKIMLFGIGLLSGGILAGIAIVCRLLPDQQRAKRLWIMVVPAVIIGSVLIFIGLK